MAALTWVLWKSRSRLQNLEATSRNFSDPTSFQIFGRHLEERVRTGSKYLELWNFLEKFGSFKTGLSRFSIKFQFSNQLAFLFTLGQHGKNEKFEPGPVGWPVQSKRRRRSSPFSRRGHHGIHGFVKQNKHQKVRTGRTPSVLVRVTCNVHLVQKGIGTHDSTYRLGRRSHGDRGPPT